MPNNTHNTIDTHIGKRAEQRRCQLGLQLETLSIYSGISIADLHRIECGKLKITAAQLFNLSHALHVSIAFFFEKYHYDKNEEIELLLAAFLCITSPTSRKKILQMVESGT